MSFRKKKQHEKFHNQASSYFSSKIAAKLAEERLKQLVTRFDRQEL
jgi:hypothetical protein